MFSQPELMKTEVVKINYYTKLIVTHMKEQINYIDELSARVYLKNAETQLENLMLKGKSLMTHEELAQHITENLSEYLSTEEQNQLLQQNLGCIEDESVKSLMMKIAIDLAALSVTNAIEKVLTEERFVGDNPFEFKKNPLLFMLYKFYDERFGVKLTKDDAGRIGPF